MNTDSRKCINKNHSKSNRKEARESTLPIPQLEASHCPSSEDKQCQTPTLYALQP